MTELRSQGWYGGDDRDGYIHRAWMRRGVPEDAFDGKRAQIAIANTASDLTPCNMHLDEVMESVKKGVYEAGGIPLDLPVVSLGETLVRPTAMLWRNMAAMAMEEMFRANPIDGLVLLGGCDKTIPALLMAAASVGIPAVVVPGGPMMNGMFRGQRMGCGTGVWQLSEEVRAGTLSKEAFLASDRSMIRSKGHCNTMGTASTMAIMAEALGMTIPGLAGTPAPDARLLEASQATGRLVVDMVREGRTIGDIITKASFHNAIVAIAATGGSTNAVVHMLAIAGRLGIDLTLEDFDRIGADVPLLVNLQPSGNVPHGGPLQRRRRARRARRGEGPARPDADHRHRPAARRLPRRQADLEHGGHLAARGAADRRRGHRRAPREPGPERRDHQARGRLGRICCSTGARRSCSTRSRTSTSASTTRTSTSRRTRC